MNNDENYIEEKSQPVCPQCLTPFEPLQHYCSHCGGTVGNYTRYIPFVNIPFEIEFSINVWKKFWSSDTDIIYKFCLFPIVISTWGPVFLIGMPFEIWKKYKKERITNSSSPS
jgi:hypothetical protein